MTYTFDDVPLVTIAPEYKSSSFDPEWEKRLHELKYVELRIEAEGRQKTVIWANDANAEKHMGLVEGFKQAAPGVNVTCLGGGRLALFEKEKQIHVWDDSVQFGEGYPREVAKLIKAHFPGFAAFHASPQDLELMREEVERGFYTEKDLEAVEVL